MPPEPLWRLPGGAAPDEDNQRCKWADRIPPGLFCPYENQEETRDPIKLNLYDVYMLTRSFLYDIHEWVIFPVTVTHNMKAAISCCCNKGVDFKPWSSYKWCWQQLQLGLHTGTQFFFLERRGVLHVRAHTHTPTCILKSEPSRGVVAINTYKQELFTDKVTHCAQQLFMVYTKLLCESARWQTGVWRLHN